MFICSVKRKIIRLEYTKALGLPAPVGNSSVEKWCKEESEQKKNEKPKAKNKIAAQMLLTHNLFYFFSSSSSYLAAWMNVRPASRRLRLEHKH